MIQNVDGTDHIAVRQPDSAEMFDRAGSDYRCRGAQMLDGASSGLDVSPEEMARTIAEAELESGKHPADWDSSTCEFLILRLLHKEHGDIEREIRDLPTLAAALAERNESRPELTTISQLVEELTEELTVHIKEEEKNVFPVLLDVELAYLGELTASGIPKGIASILKKMSEDHRALGRTLGRLRHESNWFHSPIEADGKCEELYDRLALLYGAIHYDVHVEDDILFPRVAQMGAALLH
jgi:regulator of cell morphogenesis and NO signaling